MQPNLQSDLSIERNTETGATTEVTKSGPVELTASLLKLVSGGTAELPHGTW